MLNNLIESWSSIYANHAALRTAIEFIHIGGLVAGGGCAITADLATISANRQGQAAGATHLILLERTHRLVVLGLVALTVSGVVMFAVDVQTFLYSKVFWLKMTLMVLLLVNGALLVRGERRVREGEPDAWPRLHHTATVSLVLWFLTTLAGAALPNIG